MTAKTIKHAFHDRFEKEIVPLLKKDLGIKNSMAVPSFKKAVINVGLKQGVKDPKFIDAAEKVLTRISGQKPVKTLAKKSIANFKIRQGMTVGIMATMRGRRMWDFLDKLVNVTLPRIRDFRGLTVKAIDAHGNMSIGFKEFIAFPEIRPEDTDYMHGLEVAVVTNARDRKKGTALFRAAGFPFRD